MKRNSPILLCRTILVLVFCVTGARAQAAQVPDGTPIKGTLQVNTAPPGARVSLGGSSPEFRQTLGDTPLSLEIDPGRVTLLLELDGYVPATAEIEVLPGKTALMQVKLEKETLKFNRAIRAVGHTLFWPGLVTAGTGIILIAKDDPKKDVNTGMPGYITAGIGTAMTIVGGIILGLTQSSHRDKYTMPEVSWSVDPSGRGGTVGVQKRF